MKIDVNKNSYSFVFAGIVVTIVTVLLSATSIGLKDRQLSNTQKEKKQGILYTIGVEVSRDEAEELFSKYIKDQVLDYKGGEDKNVKAFDVDLAVELKKPKTEQKFPIYLAEKDGENYYIIPLRGDGLWDAIWGYIAIEKDINTVKGVYFDHKGETPGLGAEISTKIFQQQFVGKKIFDEKGNFVSISLVKGGIKILPKEKHVYAVDAISGGTITCDAVTKMLYTRMENYLPYLEKLKKSLTKDEVLVEENIN